MKYSEINSELIDTASKAGKKFNYVQIHYKEDEKLLEKRVLEHIYGYLGEPSHDEIMVKPCYIFHWDYWRTKKPDFKWDLDRIEN